MTYRCECGTCQYKHRAEEAEKREQLLREAAEGLLAHIRDRFPDDFRDGGRGFVCPHHIKLAEALAPEDAA